MDKLVRSSLLMLVLGVCLLFAGQSQACPNCKGTVADGDEQGYSIYVHDGGTEFGIGGGALRGGDPSYDGSGGNAGEAYAYSIYFMMGTIYLVVGGMVFFTVRAFRKYRPAPEYL